MNKYVENANYVYNQLDAKDNAGIIHSISQLNTEGHELDSHAGDTENSYICDNFRETVLIPAYSPSYTRLKKMSNGKYLLFYIDYGKGISYRISDDLVNWSESKLVFKDYKLDDGSSVSYHSPDGIVLNNGTVLIAATYYHWPNYNTDGSTSGIILAKSYDNAESWVEEKKIYVGQSWEPSFIQLPSGEVHCYYTTVAPSIYLYGYDKKLRSTGSAVLRSFDNGTTWTPDITSGVPEEGAEIPFEAPRVIQTYIGIYNGQKHYNDQMPVAVKLHNGDIAMVAESIQLNHHYRTAVGISHDDFKTTLGFYDEGPEDKYYVDSPKSNFYGPYIDQFDSGEVLIHMHGGYNLYHFIADHTAHDPHIAATPLDGYKNIIWTSVSVLTPHSYVTFKHILPAGWRKYSPDNKIAMRTCYLNHRISAKKMTVCVDGSACDWADETEAFFVGKKSQAQATLRVAHDDDNIYFLVERLDRSLSKVGDDIAVEFSCDGGENKYVIKMNADSDVSFNIYDEMVRGDVAIASSAFKAGMTVIGNPDDDGEDEGYVVEVAISKNEIKMDGSDVMYVDMKLENTDNGERFPTDIMFEKAPCNIINRGKVVLCK